MRAGSEDSERIIVTIVAHDVGPVGGMERQLSELIRGLVARGAHVTLVSRTCELEPHPSLRWVRVPGPARPFVLAYPWFFVVGSFLVRRHRRGLLHTTGAIVVNRADVSSVHLCHQGARLERARARGRMPRKVHAHLAARLSRAGERIVYRVSRSRMLVCVSPRVENDLRTHLRHAPPTMTIGNGVDVKSFSPNAGVRADVRRELGIDERELVAVFVGGDWERKGLTAAADAVAASPGWSLLVVGPGDVGRWSNRPSLRFVGRVPETARYLAAGDAFVLPSQQEGDPLVVYEAAAAGLPLIVTDVGDVQRVVVDDVSGWIVPPEAAAIRRCLDLLRAEDVRQRLGAAARDAAAGCGWDLVVDRHAALYRELSGVVS